MSRGCVGGGFGVVDGLSGFLIEGCCKRFVLGSTSMGLCLSNF